MDLPLTCGTDDDTFDNLASHGISIYQREPAAGLRGKRKSLQN
ncbi:hypothetical protein O9993_16120 [Vibrio lentus]|nr:hypothetical protein [Vibrio lentus]